MLLVQSFKLAGTQLSLVFLVFVVYGVYGVYVDWKGKGSGGWLKLVWAWIGTSVHYLYS